MSLMNIRNLTAGYGKENIVEDISFILESGGIIGVLGLNGSGTSTLIKAICNLLPHSGETVILDQALEKQKAKDIAKVISYIPQHSGITMDISVMDVVMMGFNARLKLWENPGKAMYEKAKLEVILFSESEDIHTINTSDLTIGGDPFDGTDIGGDPFDGTDIGQEDPFQ